MLCALNAVWVWEGLLEDVLLYTCLQLCSLTIWCQLQTVIGVSIYLETSKKTRAYCAVSLIARG